MLPDRCNGTIPSGRLRADTSAAAGVAAGRGEIRLPGWFRRERDRRRVLRTLPGQAGVLLASMGAGATTTEGNRGGPGVRMRKVEG